MKTAISIDACLLEEADRAARKMGLSRSRLVSIALTEYLRQRRNREMTEQLNHIYAEAAEAGEQPSSSHRKAKLHSVAKGRW
jgi:metal-responsive CopG/Arc/MetJ family transcriptional regulator